MKTLDNCVNNQLTIKISEIREETFLIFLEITKVIFPEPLTILLDSKGGLITTAFDWKTQLESYSRHSKITIYNKLALSSAAVLFMAKGEGVSKFVSSSSVLSFHNPQIKGELTPEKIKLRRFYQERIESLVGGKIWGHHFIGSEILERWKEIKYAHFASKVDIIL